MAPTLVVSAPPPSLLVMLLTRMEQAEKEGAAVAFDIDDTALVDGAASTPVLRLFDFASDKGLRVFFVTARSDDPDAVDFTERQLHDAGYTRPFRLIATPDELRSNPKDIGQWKAAARAYIHDQHGPLLFMVGDMLFDVAADPTGMHVPPFGAAGLYLEEEGGPWLVKIPDASGGNLN